MDVRAAWLLCLTAGPVAVAAEEPAGPPPPRLGVTVGNATLVDMAQRPRHLAEFTAPVLVLNFWAFWCDTWKKQLPQLVELSRRQDELGFQLVTISVDGQWSDAARRYLGVAPLPFAVRLDGRRALSGPLGIRRVPTVLVLDRERRVTWLHEAYPGNPAVLRAIRAAQRPQR
ncbi:MAG: TlpA family protein disulfide reductase [Armatimonadetes bacterium]|nr:TlpA family protein disulfide reductase [Armatimonadota bacterium]